MNLSISKIKAFKACRRMYYLRYIEGLTPVQTAEALETGRNYHKMIDALNKGEKIDGGFSKEAAMVEAYKKYIMPAFHVEQSEKFLTYDLNDEDKLVGIADGIAEDGNIVEHKKVGSEITEQYEYNLLWDEQILAYMLITGARKVWYTVCRKPTIRQKQNETEEEFYNRMVAWYDEDTNSKIRLLEIERTDEEVKQFKIELYSMLEEMKTAHNMYRNTCHCNMWGRRCEYSSVCLIYDPNETYLEFEKENS